MCECVCRRGKHGLQDIDLTAYSVDIVPDRDIIPQIDVLDGVCPPLTPGGSVVRACDCRSLYALFAPVLRPLLWNSSSCVIASPSPRLPRVPAVCMCAQGWCST